MRHRHKVFERYSCLGSRGNNPTPSAGCPVGGDRERAGGSQASTPRSSGQRLLSPRAEGVTYICLDAWGFSKL